MNKQKSVGKKYCATGIARPFIYRIRVIYRELMTGQKNATYLANLLEVSTKTIHRDLDYMRDMLEMDMESSNKGRTLLDGIHKCPLCGGGCAGNNPAPETAPKNGRGMVDRILASMS